MTKPVDNAAADVAADLAALREDIARLAEAMSGLLQQKARGAGDRMAESIADAEDRIEGAAADIGDSVRVAAGDIEARIRRNPVTAVLVAFGIGMAIGIFSRSRG